MSENFDYCLKFVLRPDIEGGNDDDPHDPGGRTSRGITQHEYNAYCSIHGLPAGDVWVASQRIIDTIYLFHYWQPWCEKLPNGIDLEFFDMSVNCGPLRATRMMQRALRVEDDGHIGVITMAALKSAMPDSLIKAISQRRRFFYRQLAGYPRYGHGWFNRVDLCEKAALKMVSS